MVTEHRSLTAGENRGHEAPLPRQALPPDEVDASTCAVKPPGPKAVLNRRLTEPQLQKLSASHHSMLPSRQLPRRSTPRFQSFPRHRKEKSGNDAARPF